MATPTARPILGDSKPIQEMKRLIARISSSKTNVLIIGESGTGKELVARMIHDSGPLKGKPFIPVNCGAIPENLIESEMFGHKRGSFTGAVSDKPGLFEAANGGTLFLDEVGELPLSLQVKLLRAIQERIFRRVGGNDDIQVDVRIIAATNRDLEAAVAKGTFREDLYYRLNVLLIRTPPLRERPGDIKILAESFLKRFVSGQSKEAKDAQTERGNKEIKTIDRDAMAALEAHSWPGNVRELENVIERAVTLSNRDTLTLDCLPAFMRLGGSGGAPESAGERHLIEPFIALEAPDFSKGPIDLSRILEEISQKYIEAARRSAGGDESRAWELLGKTFQTQPGESKHPKVKKKVL